MHMPRTFMNLYKNSRKLHPKLGTLNTAVKCNTDIIVESYREDCGVGNLRKLKQLIESDVLNEKNKCKYKHSRTSNPKFENPECCPPSFYNRMLHLRRGLRNRQPQDTKQPIEVM